MRDNITPADVLNAFMEVKPLYIKIIRSVFEGWNVELDDVFYDIMVQQAEKLAKSYDPCKGCTLKTYIMGGARNQAITYFKRWKRLNPCASFDEEIHLDKSAQEKLMLSADRDTICWVLYRSNPIYAEVVTRRLNGVPVRKIASLLGVSRQTVSSRWNAFILDAKRLIQNEPPPENFAEGFTYSDAFKGWKSDGNS